MNFRGHALLENVVSLCESAGRAIMSVYTAEFEIDYKQDQSPITSADKAAHEILMSGLAALLVDVPVLSEEAEAPDYKIRRRWQRYWLVDPLDGTREFISGNGEFTVNVALIDQGEPVLGVVHAPVSRTTYIGVKGEGAEKREDGIRHAIRVRTVASRQDSNLPIEVVISRRHGLEETATLMERMENALGCVTTKSVGSSLKLCLVAEGKADLYPRLAPTCEWDTAAAQAVVEAAGGVVFSDDFLPLRYNQKPTLLNPYFYAVGDVNFTWPSVISKT
jgi:3'(2'), 5'-bisphosphate nucleotidase